MKIGNLEKGEIDSENSSRLESADKQSDALDVKNVKDVPDTAEVKETSENIEKNNKLILKEDNGNDVTDSDGNLLPNKTITIHGVEYKTDDNGKIYECDGKLLENNSYIKEGHEYKTNDNGNIYQIDGKALGDIKELREIEEKIEQLLKTPEGIKKLLEQYPEKEKFIKTLEKAINIINDPESTQAEITNALSIIDKQIKGPLLELAVKYVLKEAGLIVEENQREIEAEGGKTKPDVIAVNNTENDIHIGGMIIKPGENLLIECKCGKEQYLTNQLKEHIPKQLSPSGFDHIALLTTSDINRVDPNLVKSVLAKYGATLITLDINTETIETIIKKVNI